MIDDVRIESTTSFFETLQDEAGFKFESFSSGSSLKSKSRQDFQEYMSQIPLEIIATDYFLKQKVVDEMANQTLDTLNNTQSNILRLKRIVSILKEPAHDAFYSIFSFIFNSKEVPMERKIALNKIAKSVYETANTIRGFERQTHDNLLEEEANVLYLIGIVNGGVSNLIARFWQHFLITPIVASNHSNEEVTPELCIELAESSKEIVLAKMMSTHLNFLDVFLDRYLERKSSEFVSNEEYEALCKNKFDEATQSFQCLHPEDYFIHKDRIVIKPETRLKMEKEVKRLTRSNEFDTSEPRVGCAAPMFFPIIFKYCFEIAKQSLFKEEGIAIIQKQQKLTSGKTWDYDEDESFNYDISI